MSLFVYTYFTNSILIQPITFKIVTAEITIKD